MKLMIFKSKHMLIVNRVFTKLIEVIKIYNHYFLGMTFQIVFLFYFSHKSSEF